MREQSPASSAGGSSLALFHWEHRENRKAFILLFIAFSRSDILPLSLSLSLILLFCVVVIIGVGFFSKLRAHCVYFIVLAPGVISASGLLCCACVTMKMAAHRGKRAAQKSLGNEAKIAKMCENVRAGKRGEKESGEEPRGEVFTVERPVSTGQWTNRERVLVFSSRGIDFRTRHLMNDLKNIMPHSKADTKMERKDKLFVVNEVCEIKNCNKCIFFEAKKKQDLYMWISNVPHGPSAKFLVQNVHTLAELKMTGNCLKGSRPLLSFDPSFDAEPHYALLKELFTQIFSTPRHHPKSQPFVDHVFSFTIVDHRIWFRNYQIIEEDASLVEIGPRFVLNPIKVFQGSFGGPTLYQNTHFQAPNLQRRLARQACAVRQQQRQLVKELQKQKQQEETQMLPQDVTETVFVTPPASKHTPEDTQTQDRGAREQRKRKKLSELKKRTLLKHKH